MGVRLFTQRPVAQAQEGEGKGLRRGPEAAALLLLAVALYLSLALASLRADPADPSVHGTDWVGPVGAGMAVLLVRGFGVIAWLFPLELVLFAAPLLRHRTLKVSGLRVSGDLVIVILVTALAHIAFGDHKSFGAMPAGGNVGLLFGELFSALFSTVGSFLVCATIVGLILIGRADFSFIRFCECLLQSSAELSRRGVTGVARLKAAWREASQLRSKERAQEREKAGPQIDNKLSDEAIIAKLDDEPSWIPHERTGNPPLALAESLKLGLQEEQLSKAPAARQKEPETPAAPEQPALSPQALPSVEPKTANKKSKSATSSANSSAQPLPEQLSLRIVDTRQNAEVERTKTKKPQKKDGFTLPVTELLEQPSDQVVQVDKDRVLQLAERLESTLADYGVTGKVEEVHPGPTVTTYEVSPQAGTKVSKVAGLSDDLALGLSRKVRIIAPIPGKARIGFELPNDKRIPVNLRELIEDKRFEKLASKAPLPVVLGRDIVGAPCFADLASMPHVIVAGATGAGKSVGLNVMLSSLLFKRSPDELRMLMIDPKVVELAPFDGIPHMLLPVVTDMKQAAKALKWAVDEMEKRYQAFAIAGTKNISTYNLWVDKVQRGDIEPPAPAEVEALTADGAVVSVPASKTGGDGASLPGRLPHIVIVVDEFADLMMQQGKEVEASVARLAQKARAAGMHVVLATQRPSVDVITGMIKANFPTRIAFRVAQKVDSRTILDEMGAELLLGKGDMLVKLNGSTETHRVQCPFVSEEEVARLTDYLRTQGTPHYCDDILKGDDEEEGTKDADSDLDPRFDEAVAIVAQTQRCSTSWLQRKMTIGYNRAAKIVESMEARGIVGPPNGSKDREIFVHPQ